MKRISFLTLSLMVYAMTMTAQSEPSNIDSSGDMVPVYCELIGINNNVLGIGNKISVEINFGDEQNFWGNDGRDILIDENGKEIKFNSMVDAMNFMGEKGWKYEDSFVVSTGKQNVIHWLLSKRIRRGEEARGGIMQKRDKKKNKKKRNDEYKYADPIYD